MSPEPSDPSKAVFTISYKKAHDYKIFPCSGVWGGPSPDATKLIVNLMVEHRSIPSYETFDIGEGGNIDLTRIKDSVSAGNMERELVCGILLTSEDARSIGAWLINHANEMDARRSKK
jgi:hypothetical protein